MIAWLMVLSLGEAMFPLRGFPFFDRVRQHGCSSCVSREVRDPQLHWMKEIRG